MARTDPALWLQNYGALFGKADEPIRRWNEGQPAGTPVTVTYRFAETYPAYSEHLRDPTTEFRPFPLSLQAVAKEVMAEVEKMTNITFVEDRTKPEDQIDILMSGTIYGGGAGNPPSLNWKYAGDMYIGFGPATESPQYVYDHAGDGSYAQFRDTFVHELGHTLGLWHPLQYQGPDGVFNETREGYRVAIDPTLENKLHTAMSYYAPAGATDYQWVRTFMPLDILALQELYGKDTTTTAGNNVYQFDAINPGVRTLWDAGGFDTLDLSNMSAAVNVDLRVGGVSDIGVVSITSDWAKGFRSAAKGNVVIGPDTVVEAVTGSAFDDAILGNDADNFVAGLAGNDVLSGGAGADDLLGGAGADTLIGGSGDDKLDGGTGLDNAAYSSFYRGYGPSVLAGSTTLHGSAAEGTDTLTSIETITFEDGVLQSDQDAAFAQVLRAYHTVLGRAPDPVGLDFYVDRMEGAGMSLAGVANDLSGSAEFQAATGGLSNGAFVEYVYTHALDRSADAGGAAYYTQALDRGLSRGVFVVELSESGEHRALTADMVANGFFNTDDSYQAVALLFDSFAGRKPDAGGLSYYSERLKAGSLTLAQAANDFAGSTEFQQATSGLSNGQLVDYMYRNTLDREPDAGGRAYYTNALNQGLSKGALLLEFSQSQEHYNYLAGSIVGGIDVL